MEGAPLVLDLGGRASMTFLRHYNQCPRSAYLYRTATSLRVQSIAMLRGEALHTIIERATLEAERQGEESVPPEVVKAIATEVFAEVPLPIEEHDYVRECAYRWAGEWRLQPELKRVAIESLFVLELEGIMVRARVDFAEKDSENALYVADYKSGRGAPSYDSIGRKREGPANVAGKTFQLIVYVLAIALGRPVLSCESCHGEGVVRYLERPPDPQTEAEAPCGVCGGAGHVLGEQRARGCQEAIAEYVYPGIEDSEGRMLRRTVGWTRLELLEYLESLEALLRRLKAERRWPAIVSDLACGECAAPLECPIPAQLRDFRGAINTDEQLRAVLQRRHVEGLKSKATGREVRAFIEKVREGAPVRYGRRVAELVPRESTEIRDKDGLIAALASGMPEAEARAKFVRVSKGTSLSERDLTDDELNNETGGE